MFIKDTRDRSLNPSHLSFVYYLPEYTIPFLRYEIELLSLLRQFQKYSSLLY